MEEFGMEYLNGLHPSWFHRVWGTVTTIPLEQQPQDGGSEGIASPTAPQDCCAATHNMAVLQEYLEPHQLCMTLGGAHKLVHCVRMLMEVNRDWVCV